MIRKHLRGMSAPGAPFIRDIVLAERLGFERPRAIRQLIERHLSALEEYGVCHMVWQTSGRDGGRPSTEYRLNKKQAIYVATLSGIRVCP